MFFCRKRLNIAELSSSDFSTPEKRRKNLKFVKTKVQSQRQKIHVLQMKVRRLKSKVTSLNSLLKEKFDDIGDV